LLEGRRQKTEDRRRQEIGDRRQKTEAGKTGDRDRRQGDRRQETGGIYLFCILTADFLIST